MVHDPDYPCPTHDAYKRVSLCKLPDLRDPSTTITVLLVPQQRCHDTAFNVTQCQCPIPNAQVL